MNVLLSNVKPGPWRGRLVAIAIFAAVCLFVARAQSPTPPYALFQNAVLTGSGNTINATRIPVITQSGVPVYLNMTLQFNVDNNGNLTLANGFPQVSASAALLTSNFKAGTYVGASTILSGKTMIALSGPGIADGGATQWSLNAASGADPCTTPVSATWYDGPIATSPYAARINAAKITSTSWSYGIGGANGCNANIPSLVPNSWASGSLLGFTQNANTLTIATFTRLGSDSNSPIDQITFTLQ